MDIPKKFLPPAADSALPINDNAVQQVPNKSPQDPAIPQCRDTTPRSIEMTGAQAYFGACCQNGSFHYIDSEYATSLNRRSLSMVTVTTTGVEKEETTAKNTAFPLHAACNSGDLAAVQSLLKNSEIDINKTDHNRQSSLFLACSQGHIQIVHFLLNNNADINLSTVIDETPLYIACRNGYIDIVNLLLKKGASTNHANEMGNFTALEIALYSGYSRIAKAILEYDIHSNNRYYEYTTAIYIAVEKGYLDLVEILLQSSDDLINDENLDGRTALHIAAIFNHLDIARMLIDRGAAIDKVDNEGWAALHFAVKHNSAQIACLLLRYGASIDQETYDRYTPLMLAVKYHKELLVRILVVKGATVIFEETEKTTPLEISLNDSSDFEVADYLLEHIYKEMPVNKVNSTLCWILENEPRVTVCKHLVKVAISMTAAKQMTVLHKAAMSNQRNALKAILAYGVNPGYLNVDVTDDKKQTPLYMASQNGHISVVEWLLSHKADIHKEADDLTTPLLCAVTNQHHKMIRVMLDFCRKPTRWCRAFDKACKIGGGKSISKFIINSPEIELEMIQALWQARFLRSLATYIKKIKPNLCSFLSKIKFSQDYALFEYVLKCCVWEKNNQNLFSYLCENNQADAVRFLLNTLSVRKQLGQIETLKSFFSSPLSKDESILEKIFQYKDCFSSIINHRDGHGNNLLMVACMNGNLGAVRRLIDCGADITVGKVGATYLVIEIAKAKKHYAIERILQKKMKEMVEDNMRRKEQEEKTKAHVLLGFADVIQYFKGVRCGEVENFLDKSIQLYLSDVDASVADDDYKIFFEYLESQLSHISNETFIMILRRPYSINYIDRLILAHVKLTAYSVSEVHMASLLEICFFKKISGDMLKEIIQTLHGSTFFKNALQTNIDQLSDQCDYVAWLKEVCSILFVYLDSDDVVEHYQFATNRLVEFKYKQKEGMDLEGPEVIVGKFKKYMQLTLKKKRPLTEIRSGVWNYSLAMAESEFLVARMGANHSSVFQLKKELDALPYYCELQVLSQVEKIKFCYQKPEAFSIMLAAGIFSEEDNKLLLPVLKDIEQKVSVVKEKVSCINKLTEDRTGRTAIDLESYNNIVTYLIELKPYLPYSKYSEFKKAATSYIYCVFIDQLTIVAHLFQKLGALELDIDELRNVHPAIEVLSFIESFHNEKCIKEIFQSVICEMQKQCIQDFSLSMLETAGTYRTFTGFVLLLDMLHAHKTLHVETLLPPSHDLKLLSSCFAMDSTDSFGVVIKRLFYKQNIDDAILQRCLVKIKGLINVAFIDKVLESGNKRQYLIDHRADIQKVKIFIKLGGKVHSKIDIFRDAVKANIKAALEWKFTIWPISFTTRQVPMRQSFYVMLNSREMIPTFHSLSAKERHGISYDDFMTAMEDSDNERFIALGESDFANNKGFSYLLMVQLANPGEPERVDGVCYPRDIMVMVIQEEKVKDATDQFMYIIKTFYWLDKARLRNKFLEKIAEHRPSEKTLNLPTIHGYYQIPE